MTSRREFLRGASVVGGVSAAGLLLPPWALSAAENNMSALTGTDFDLNVRRKNILVDGRPSQAICVNGQVPAPLLRWQEGSDVTLRVNNHLDVPTSIHWHGILLPFQMDGVPGVSFPGIKAGGSFTYKFPIKQAGTYWYHSHSGLQEQAGHYGPIIIDPAGADPVQYDREYVLVLSDWTFMKPETVFAKLKKSSDVFNYQQRTMGEFARDAKEQGFERASQNRSMWGAMRMNPTDIADVTGEAYTYLINGHGPMDNWTGLFEPGQRIRLRVINASAMTIFNVRIPGLPMTVVQSDGLNVQPVETDEFQIGVAETFDVVVQPKADAAYTIMCESIDRSGYGRATLAPRPDMVAAVPALRDRPTLTMKDMAMDHGAMRGSMDGHAGHDMKDMPAKPVVDHSKMDHAAMGHGVKDKGGQDKAVMDHAAMGHGPKPAKDGKMTGPYPHNHRKGAGVVGLAERPVNRLAERGIGLENEPHRVLVYTDLKALDRNPDLRAPEREVELHLTSNMERYMWSFDGIKFSEVDGPILFHQGERLRLHMVNDTMMAHPVHLHGMFFDVVTDEGDHKPRKHTIVTKPGEKLAVDVTADAYGDWAFHCHLLYHMHAGMMRVVSVRPPDGKADKPVDHKKMKHDHGGHG